MPRSVNLAQLPPPEAVCYACGQTVALDRRARGRAKFRCPHCRADNRVDHTGAGWPLRGPAERVEAMPEVHCLGCQSINRLPQAVRQRKEYRCFHCQAAQPVPPALRLPPPPSAWWAFAACTLLVIIFCLAYFGLELRQTVKAVAQGLDQHAVAEMMDSIETGQPDARHERDGDHVRVEGAVSNYLDKPATLHLRLEVMQDETPLMSQTISLVAVAPGQRRRFAFHLYSPNRLQMNRMRVELFGVS
jgi:hypothetical protein